MRLAALVLGLVLACALLEVALRFLAGGAPSRLRSVAVYEKHPPPFFESHLRTSPTPAHGSEKFRLFVVGDSFTWGVGIYHEDTYGRRLETLLERMNSQLDVELTLVSRPGWNTGQEFDALRREIHDTTPDLILLGFCLNDAEPPHRAGIEDLMEPLDRRRPKGLISQFLYQHSRVVTLVWERLENSRQVKAFNRYYAALYEHEGWQAAQSSLDDLRQLAWDAKAPLVVAVFPVFDQQFDSEYSYLPLHHLVMDALRQRDIVATDLLRAYRGIDTARLAVEPFTDPHPNELAHRLASQHLAYFLVEQELVPVSREQLDQFELSLRQKRKIRNRQ